MKTVRFHLASGKTVDATLPAAEVAEMLDNEQTRYPDVIEFTVSGVRRVFVWQNIEQIEVLS